MKKSGIWGILVFSILLIILIVSAVIGQGVPSIPANPALVQQTGDVEVRILPAATEIVLPVGTSFVFSRQSDGRVVLRFVHMNAIPSRLGLVK